MCHRQALLPFLISFCLAGCASVERIGLDGPLVAVGEARPRILLPAEVPRETAKERIRLRVGVEDPDGIRDVQILANGTELRGERINRQPDGQRDISVEMTAECLLQSGINRIEILATNARGTQNAHALEIARTPQPAAESDSVWRRFFYHLLKAFLR